VGGLLKEMRMHDFVFLFDVDNTLLDNDRVQADLSRHLETAHGPAARDRYLEIFEDLRTSLGYADYLGALQRYRLEALHDPRVLRIANWLADYPFADRLYPSAMDAVQHASLLGTPVILSDGDAAFQPRKVDRSGLWHAFADHVLIFVHKEECLDDVERLYPARHYVMIDDKLRILDAIKRSWGERVTTVFPRQGHYAYDPAILSAYPAGDITIDSIGELTKYDAATLYQAASRRKVAMK
jgi:FMN phosphatase YigB (HAD superfamily)